MAIKFLNTVAVDTDVLFVDTTNNRVGIGTTSPLVELEVDGSIMASGSSGGALRLNADSASNSGVQKLYTFYHSKWLGSASR